MNKRDCDNYRGFESTVVGTALHATQLQRRPSLHIMQNWAGCAWPQRGQLYKGARRLLRKRKEEELTGLHIASPLSERRRIYTTCKAAA